MLVGDFCELRRPSLALNEKPRDHRNDTLKIFRVVMVSTRVEFALRLNEACLPRARSSLEDTFALLFLPAQPSELS